MTEEKKSEESTDREMTGKELLALLSHPDTILTRRTPAQRLELAKIMEKITLQNRQEEVDCGAPVGKESL